MKVNNVFTFKGTKKQADELAEVILKHRDERGALMPILQEAQDIYGYLPIEVQTMIAEGLNISLSEVYGVATFYSQFSLTPKGENRISVCLGTACYVKGSDKIVEEIKKILGIDVGGISDDGVFSLDATRCVGACGLAPVMMVNDDVYGKVEVAQVKGILDKYTKKPAGGNE